MTALSIRDGLGHGNEGASGSAQRHRRPANVAEMATTMFACGVVGSPAQSSRTPAAHTRSRFR